MRGSEIGGAYGGIVSHPRGGALKHGPPLVHRIQARGGFVKKQHPGAAGESAAGTNAAGAAA